MILVGDARERLLDLPDASVQTCITSPPYFGLRDYGTGSWEGGDPGCEHRAAGGRGSYAGAGGESAYAAASGLRGAANRAHVAGAPHRGGAADRCACGAVRVDSQIGLEGSPAEYVAALVGVFREVRRVLRDDGTVWLNLGDTYNAYNANRGGATGLERDRARETARPAVPGGAGLLAPGLKKKDLIGLPWMVAFALRDDGWYLRSEVVWAKPNPMPESVTDRPTRAHEQVFLLAKRASYYYDQEAIREAATWERPHSPALSPYGQGFRDAQRWPGIGAATAGARLEVGENGHDEREPMERLVRRNKRSVWEVATKPFAEAHFAVMPTELVEPCVLAGSSPRACGECGAPWHRLVERERTRDGEPLQGSWASPDDPRRLGATGVGHWRDETSTRTAGWAPGCGHGDGSARSVVLDPFAGAGTVGVVAAWHGREFVGVELNARYAAMAERRIAAEGPLGRRAYRPLPPGQEALFA